MKFILQKRTNHRVLDRTIHHSLKSNFPEYQTELRILLPSKTIRPEHDNKNRKRVPFREVAIGGNGDLALLAGDGDGVTESAGLAADLDSLLEELF